MMAVDSADAEREVSRVALRCDLLTNRAAGVPVSVGPSHQSGLDPARTGDRPVKRRSGNSRLSKPGSRDAQNKGLVRTGARLGE